MELELRLGWEHNLLTSVREQLLCLRSPRGLCWAAAAPLVLVDRRWTSENNQTGAFIRRVLGTSSAAMAPEQSGHRPISGRHLAVASIGTNRQRALNP